jgi:mannan endo-1,4-beta-mannosidase
MPWYDYGRTNNPNSSDFKSTDHSSCNTAWWNEAFSNDFVLTRDDMKVLRQTAAGIEEIKNSSNDTVMYDLNGRRITCPVHGLNIINAKKVFIK